MKKLQYIAATAAAVSTLSALAAASAQTPSAKQSGKQSATQQKSSGIQILSGAAADNLVLESTGKPVDKAAMKAREEAEAESNRAVSEGEAFLKVGKTQEAIASYGDALAITPTDGLAYRRLAEAYTASGKLNEASQTFHKVLIEGFGPGVGNGVGGSADIWAEYALVLVKTNQAAEAVQAYNNAAYLLDYEVSGPEKGQPKVKVLLPEIIVGEASAEQIPYTLERLQALADTALAHEESAFGSLKEAQAHMQEAVSLYPDSAVTHYYRGEALLGPVHSAESKAEYQKAVELGDDKTAAAAKERMSVLR